MWRPAEDRGDGLVRCSQKTSVFEAVHKKKRWLADVIRTQLQNATPPARLLVDGEGIFILLPKSVTLFSLPQHPVIMCSPLLSPAGKTLLTVGQTQLSSVLRCCAYPAKGLASAACQEAFVQSILCGKERSSNQCRARGKHW